MKARSENPETGNARALATRDDVEKAEKFLKDHFEKVIRDKGWGTLTSRHEALGVIRLEYRELEDAMQEGAVGDVKHELADLAAACQFTLACIEAGTMDW